MMSDPAVNDKGSRVLSATAVAVLCCASARADTVDDLVVFSAGTTARADEVNGNFSEVADAVNGNDALISGLMTQLDEAHARIETLEMQLSNLISLNDYLSLETVNGQPTVRVTAANLQIVNGMNATATTNGTGNLLVGYDEDRFVGDEQCSLGTDPNTGTPVTDEAGCTAAGGLWALSHKVGSHYLIVGAENSYTRWGGIVAGFRNTGNYDFASVGGGFSNMASGLRSSVSGGRFNTARGLEASVSGGVSNVASAVGASVSGGIRNLASGSQASVSGGRDNLASGSFSAVSGGSDRSVVGASDWAAGSLIENDP